MRINIKEVSSLIIFFFFIFINKAAALDVNLTNPLSTSDFNKLVGNTLQWVLSVAGSVALIMLIFGGITYITAAGDEQRITTAKRTITWAILGLTVVLLSYAIIAVLDKILR
jgi:hypothetical protein